MHSHSHSQHDNRPLWKKLLSAVPIVGSFMNPEYTTHAEVADGVFKETAAMSSQVTSMYCFPVQLTAHFPKLSNNAKTQMKVRMGFEMAGRMWIGDVAGGVAYHCISAPVKATINYCRPDTFKLSLKQWGIDLAKLIPLIGPFVGHNSTKETIQNGLSGNLSYLAMLAGGTITMMLSPYGMQKDAVSVTVSTSLMIAGMATTMVADALIRESVNQCAQRLHATSIWHHHDGENQAIDEERESLLENNTYSPTDMV